MKYKVGDRVLIRQWDDMVKEFGLDKDGDIVCSPFPFIADMKVYCGQVLTISEAYDGNYLVKEDKRFFWTNNMIERRVDMTKSELKSGMVVEIRGGDRMICIDNNGKLVLMNLNGESYMYVDDMDDDMSYPIWCDHCTIMKVFASQKTLDDCRSTKKIIWERPEAKEMTVADIEKALGYPVKIVKEKTK